MRVLIGCEFSGIVRDAFARRGHEAWSCDLLPSESKDGLHIQGDVLKVIGLGWDLMIAHPPCTYLSVAGNAWLKQDGRLVKREEAFQFFMTLFNAPIPKVCCENPVGYIGTAFRKADQTVNPFDFGEAARKRTCFWLRGLKPLSKSAPLFTPDLRVEPEAPIFQDTTTGKKRYFTDSQSPGKERWKDRSRTFQGIANAMAEQWG